MIDKVFGSRLIHLRKSKRLKQHEVASKLGVSYRGYQRWEAGHIPSIKNQAKICNFFKCTGSFLPVSYIPNMQEQRRLPMKTVRAKFECYEVAKTVNGITVRMSPVTGTSEENESFFKWTPSGSLEMGVINPEIEFIPGQEYYLDFTPAS